MATQVLLFSWLAVAVAGPIAGLLAGPRLRRALSRRAIIILTIASGSVAAAVFTPISFAGVLPDHLALMSSYAWTWVLVGMLRSRLVRALIVGLPTLATVWIARDVATQFFLVIVLADLTTLPQRTMSVGCGWTTRTTRAQRYGWVARSGYDLSVSARPWGLPIEIELDRRRFDDYRYESGDQFSMSSAAPFGCTTVIAYDGVDQWRVK